MKFTASLLLLLGCGLCVSSPRAATLNASSTLADSAAPASASAASTQFDPVIDDLPLMAGLTPVPDQATLFTTEAGRIADSKVQGVVDIDNVYRFYRNALPHLGWKMLSPRQYHRNHEKLTIDAHADGKITTVRFSVKPD